MSDDLRSVLLGTLALDAAVLAALCLTIARGRITGGRSERLAAGRLVVLAVTVQAAHFAEELATGFHRRFPQLLGLSAWSDAVFVSFNLFWLAIWMLSIPGLLAGRSVALFAGWFLAIACAVNGLAHPSIALVTGGYFPGLFTSLLSGIAGVLLLRGLARITQPSPVGIRYY